jgi:hypothetical protein
LSGLAVGSGRAISSDADFEHFRQPEVDALPPMNRTIIVTLLALVAAAALFFGYRAYKLSAERDLAQQRAAAEMALARQRQAEIASRAAAIAEARRMAEARAKEEMERLEKIRQEQEAAQAALAAAEAEVARLAALLADKKDASEEAARLAAERERASAQADAARLAALKKLHDLDEEKRLIADRRAAREAALRRQLAWEAEAERLRLERERDAAFTSSYLVTDIKSILIIKPDHPAPAPVDTSASPPKK